MPVMIMLVMFEEFMVSSLFYTVQRDTRRRLQFVKSSFFFFGLSYRIKKHEERTNKHATTDATPEGALPAYLLDREGVSRSKILSNTVKQKRKEKAGKWTVPVPKVQPIADAEMFRVLATGKRKQNQWKRMITKVTFVGEGFTRKPPKYERFIRPTGLRFKKAHVTHPELQTTFYLDIISVKKNPQSKLYSELGVITKGTIIEVNVSELGLVTESGKVVWGRRVEEKMICR